MCLSCSVSIFPFQQLLNIDLTDEFTSTVPTALSTVHINDNFNLNNILGHNIEDDRNEVILLQAFNKCDYYDALEFNKLLNDYNTSDRSLKVFHTTIRSTRRNLNNLINLLASIKTKFDVISLTEIWNDNVNNAEFLPDSIEGYNDYLGTPGTIKN